MKLRYTAKALVELDDVLGHISEHSPQGAQRVRSRIQAALKLVTEYPRSGHAAHASHLRKIRATPYPYLIFYEVKDEEVVVIGVRHGARDPTSMPGS